MARDQLERLPQRLLDSPYTAGVSQPMADLSEELLESARELCKQFYAHTATEAGLAEWERLTGRTPAPDATLEERRQAVVAQLCIDGASTVALIESMAKALTGYDVEITEAFSEYTFSLRFYGDQAGFIQVDAALLRETVEVIKPAHLQFKIAPITWGDLETAGLTWAQMEAQFPTWAHFELLFYCHLKTDIGGIT